MKIQLCIYREYTHSGWLATKFGELNLFHHPGSQFKIVKTPLPDVVLVETNYVRPRRFDVCQMPDYTVLTEQ